MTEKDDETTRPETEVRALVDDYEKQLDEMAMLVTRVRHEINNPLTGILGQAQLLLREPLDEKTRKRVETIEQLATRLRDIVAELRQVQRPINATRELQNKPKG
jgi:signal transduction histidine kinase